MTAFEKLKAMIHTARELLIGSDVIVLYAPTTSATDVSGWNVTISSPSTMKVIVVSNQQILDQSFADILSREIAAAVFHRSCK